jgi:multidrug resistance efflux pump
MEALLLGIYAFFVWLIFIKFKLLPWTTPWKVTVVIIPIVALTSMILALNIVAPSSADVRVFKYVVQIIPQVKGRVLEVPVEPNRLVKKGELLFRIDPTQYQNELNVAKAKLAADEAKLNQASANVVDVSAGARQLQEQLKSATAQVRALQPRLALARLRVRQYRELVATGAGDRFSLEQAEANVIDLQNQLATATANEAQVSQKLSGQVNGEQATVAGAKAQFATAKAQVDSSRADVANAQWNLDQTTMYAPTSGYAINVQLRPGSYVVAGPFAPAMTFVEEQYQVIALYQQNELWLVKPGDEAEFSLNTYPGRIIKAKVDSIVWAQGQGQVQGQITQFGGALPQTGVFPQAPGRYPVRLEVEDKDRSLFLAAGANGHGAIYTQHGEVIHLVRKVILRIGAITDYLILKLH